MLLMIETRITRSLMNRNYTQFSFQLDRFAVSNVYIPFFDLGMQFWAPETAVQCRIAQSDLTFLVARSSNILGRLSTARSVIADTKPISVHTFMDLSRYQSIFWNVGTLESIYSLHNFYASLPDEYSFLRQVSSGASFYLDYLQYYKHVIFIFNVFFSHLMTEFSAFRSQRCSAWRVNVMILKNIVNQLFKSHTI